MSQSRRILSAGWPAIARRSEAGLHHLIGGSCGSHGLLPFPFPLLHILFEIAETIPDRYRMDEFDCAFRRKVGLHIASAVSAFK